MDLVAALVRDYGLPVGDVERWVDDRRALLRSRADPSADARLAVSSGCAASGARTHGEQLAEDASRALARLESGLASTCETCAALIPWERLDAAPLAVRCVTCARPSTLDTRWCR